ncbi:hypothetical protein [Roseateles sp.]|uniref:hypothetical protein n=1 Tax=Roseateles sp. TaxID=1971397 RepID=UPI00326451B6
MLRALFNEKRGQILAGFLARPRLYGCKALHARLDEPARRNLAEAIQRCAA